MFEYHRHFNHTRQVAPIVRVAESNLSQVQISVIRHFTSVRWHRWLADKKGIWPASHTFHTSSNFTKIVEFAIIINSDVCPLIRVPNMLMREYYAWRFIQLINFWHSDICDDEMLLRLLLLSVHLTSAQVDGSPTALLCHLWRPFSSSISGLCGVHVLIVRLAKWCNRMRCEHWCYYCVGQTVACSVNECASEL